MRKFQNIGLIGFVAQYLVRIKKNEEMNAFLETFSSEALEKSEEMKPTGNELECKIYAQQYYSPRKKTI
jgi:hypothetical protein